MNALSIILGSSLAITLIFLIYFVLAYIFLALGLQTIANKNNLENSWLAWIPIANMYLLGMLVKNESKIPYIEWVLPIGPIVINLFSFSSFLTSVVGIAYTVVLIMSYYELYKKQSKNDVLLTVLSVIFPFLLPFFVFAIRNNQIVHTSEQISM